MGTSLTSGFDHHYRPDAPRIQHALETGLIVLDANVLLNILRYSPEAREELIAVLEGIADRCFIPHQVAVEYNRNRVLVVADRRRELDEIDAEIAQTRAKVQTVVNKLRNRRTLSDDSVVALEGAVSQFFGALEGASSDAAKQYDLEPDAMVGTPDSWTQRLEEIFAGRVAERPDAELLEKDAAEGERRANEKLAPGFKDSKPGDYMWWAEVLRCKDLQGKPLVVVSDDAAKDDWRHVERGFVIGPQPNLVEDTLAAGGSDLILLTTRDLLRAVENSATQKVSATTIEESARVLESQNPEWNFVSYIQLLDTLLSEGYADRVDVLQEAASNGGFIYRQFVYDIIGSDEASRSLRHYATPVNRIARSLVETGNLRGSVTEAMLAEYEGPGKAVGYSVPNEFEHFFSLLESLILDIQLDEDWNETGVLSANLRDRMIATAGSHNHLTNETLSAILRLAAHM